MFRRKIAALLLFAALFSLLGIASGCGYEPDISAPERVEIERRADWQGALLYIADGDGPVPGFGSIRIYDNVSGFVEKTVEQVAAAAPGDVFVTPEGSSMFVAGGNGLIDKFRWDGNNWISGGVTVETPATALLALKSGPDQKLYAVDGSPGAGVGRIYVLDPANDQLAPEPILIPTLSAASGIAFSPDGSTAYVTGTAAGTSAAQLLFLSWPSAQIEGIMDMPMASVHQVTAAPDGRFVYVAGRGEVLKVDPVAKTVAASYKPAPETGTDYTDADFSADGRFLFVVGTPPGRDSTLYVLDLETLSVVKTVEHISSKANGIQRVE